MKWKQPPAIKIYEALGAIADNRIEVTGNTAKVYSSSMKKFYDVSYDKEQNAIMTNDNGSYWQGYLGYPAITFLLRIGEIELKPELAKLLKDIKWKDINTKFKNDFEKTLKHIQETLKETNRKQLATYVLAIQKQIKELNLNLLGKRVLPPEGY